MIKTETCLACGGSGKTLSGNTCACGGSGKVSIVVPDPPKPSSQRTNSKVDQVRSQNEWLSKRKPEKVETKASRPNKSFQGKPSHPAAKRKWNWGAGIIGFLVMTGMGMKRLGLERDAALIVGGIAGIIFGFYYRQIIVLAIIAFIAYAILQKQ